jgi:hypothetical protein
VLIREDGGHHTYTFHVEKVVKALSDDVRQVPSDWYFTGQSTKPPVATPLIGGHNVLMPEHPEDDTKIPRWIYPGRALRKGETETVGVVTEVEDDLRPMNKFLRASSPLGKTDYLEVTVRFPRDEDPTLVESAVWDRKAAASGARKVDMNMTRNYNSGTDTMDYRVRVNKPDKRLRYGLRWR